MDDEADMITCSIYVTYSRSLVIDYGIPFTNDFTTFFVPKQSNAYSFEIFKKPFRRLTWAAVYTIIILAAFGFAFVARAGREKMHPEFTVTKCFIFVYGAFSGFAARRWSVTPKNISSR